MIFPSASITQILQDTDHSGIEALKQVFPLVYDELRGLAHAQLRKQQHAPFDTTELVHEAYLRLSEQQQFRIENRKHFYALAAIAMRHLLVDHFRKNLAEKRGENPLRVTLEGQNLINLEQPEIILALDEGLAQLEKEAPRMAQVVVLRFFTGLNHTEIAALLNVSIPTIDRDWRFAKAWLLKYINQSLGFTP